MSLLKFFLNYFIITKYKLSGLICARKKDNYSFLRPTEFSSRLFSFSLVTVAALKLKFGISQKNILRFRYRNKIGKNGRSC